MSFVGFTCGVGLCEELCKALPLLWHYRSEASMGWRGAALWGLASGVGFGVAEGIMYSSRYYNGISPLNMYVVRFVSCVALHAIWSASVGITIWRRQETIQGDLDWTNFALAILQILAVPMVLARALRHAAQERSRPLGAGGRRRDVRLVRDSGGDGTGQRDRSQTYKANGFGILKKLPLADSADFCKVPSPGSRRRDWCRVTSRARSTISVGS